MLGIKPLKSLIAKFGDEFTPVHRFYACLSLSAKCYRQALPIIEKQILKGYESGSALDIMNYNYYRGLIFIGLDEFDKAMHCFQLVLDTPYHSLHVLQTQALKKLVLLTWLTSTHNPNDNEHKAVRVSIRSLISSKGMTGKHLEHMCSSYTKAENINKFFVMLHQDDILKDTNLGLVNQVITKLRNEVLESLTLTYNMLDIEEIGKRLQNHREFLNLKEEQEKAELLRKLKDKLMQDANIDTTYDDDDVYTVLIKMIKSGRIRAKIDTIKNIVVFDDEESDMASLVSTIERQSKDIIHILGKIKDTDKDLILQKKAGLYTMMEEEIADDMSAEAWMEEM